MNEEMPDGARRTRLAVVWPRSRAQRWRQGRLYPTDFPDASDALLFLEREGFDVAIEDSTGLPLNPLARMHEFYSGFDPVRALRVVSRARRYDVIACIGDVTALAILWWCRAFRIRLPIVLIDPALSHDYPRRKRVQDYVLPRVKHVVVFGKAQEQYLEEQYGGRIPVTRLDIRVDTEFFHPIPVQPSGAPYIFSIGNDRSRDFATLAKAADICRKVHHLPHRFVVQTQLPVYDPGRALHLDRTMVSFPRLRELYAGAAAVVIPLHDMIHPGGISSLLEAMAVGCPVITTTSRGIADYVVPGVTAVPAGDADALARAIAQIVESPDAGGSLGSQARAFVVQHCANTVYARAMAAVIRSACS